MTEATKEEMQSYFSDPEPMLIILDKDGTICRNKYGKKFVNDWTEQELIPGVKERIAALKAQGHKIAIASNQGGVAWGFMSYDDAWMIMHHARREVGADKVFWCPHHPDGKVEEYAIECECRKPGIKMIAHAMRWAQVSRDNVIFVGDRPEDEQAAANAGVAFRWAWEFFGWDEPKQEWDPWEASDRKDYGHK